LADLIREEDRFAFEHDGFVLKRDFLRANYFAQLRDQVLGPLSRPGIAERRATSAWSVRDRMRRILGQPWRDAGVKTPAAPAHSCMTKR
jgi:hypothetical protein